MNDTITITGGGSTITLADDIADDLYANVTVTNPGAVTGTISYPWTGTGTGGFYTVGSSGAGTNYPWSYPANVADTTATNAKLTVKGDAHFENDILVKGRSITEALDRIEERLKIVPDIKFDPELERRWDELRELGEQYRALLAETREKEEMWEILKR